MEIRKNMKKKNKTAQKPDRTIRENRKNKHRKERMEGGQVQPTNNIKKK